MPEDSELVDVLTESASWGFLGPGPIETHLAHAHGYAQGLPTGLASGLQLQLLDLGSGGGVPGLPLLVGRHDLSGVLLDASTRRTDFLRTAVKRLGLADRVEVITGRAEELLARGGWSGRFDCVVARSFGPPSVTLELAAHFCSPGGSIQISEPPGGRAWSAEGLEKLGVTMGSDVGDSIARFERGEVSIPLRRWKAMTARPLVAVTK